MSKYSQFLLIIYALVTNSSYAQILDLNPGKVSQYIRSQSIFPNEGRLSINIRQSLKTSSFSHNSAVNINGNTLILNNRLVKNDNSVFREISVPFSTEQTFRNTILSSEGNILVIKQSQITDASNSRLHFFDIQQEKLIAEYTDTKLSFVSLAINSRADIISYIGQDGLDSILLVVDRENDVFTSSEIQRFYGDGRYVSPRIQYFSPQGHRIIYSVDDWVLRTKKWFVMDKNNQIWTEPIEWSIFDEFGNDLGFGIVDYANNGKTLLVWKKETGLAITEEQNDEWSTPVPIGYFPESGYDAQISENGKVIAIQSLKRTTDLYNFYDVFTVIQDTQENWITTQVNDPQLEVWDGVLLSDDGSQLFWLPANTSSIPNAEEYK